MNTRKNNPSILITGGNKDFRKTEALNLALPNSSNLDTHIIDTQEEHGIAVVREIIGKTSLMPFESSLTSLIILEADKLTIEAQNALLKILEEPPQKSQLILTSESRDSLLPTVASRLTEIKLDWSETENESLELAGDMTERLTKAEKINLDQFIAHWQKVLKENVDSDKTTLQKLHRYNHLLLKLKKAEKANVNKKLISLILALESP